MTAVGPIVITTTFPNLVVSEGVNVGEVRSSTPIARIRVGWALPVIGTPRIFRRRPKLLYFWPPNRGIADASVRDSTGQILAHRVPRGSGVTLASCAGGIPPAECASVTSRPSSRLSAGRVDSESRRRGDVGQLVDRQHPDGCHFDSRFIRCNGDDPSGIPAILDIEDGAVLGRDALIDNPNETRARWLVGASIVEPATL